MGVMEAGRFRILHDQLVRLGGQQLPGRTDRLIIAPHDLRTADATRAAEIYAGRFVFAGKIVPCHGRSIFDLEPPSEDWEAALLGFGWLRHLRAADTALTRDVAIEMGADGLPNTFVPGRNLVFLTFAAALACLRGRRHGWNKLHRHASVRVPGRLGVQA